MPIEIINLHPDGQARWNCECGRILEAPEAFKHALMKHECVFEVYFGGRWLNDGVTVGDMILLGKQQRGENVSEFVERVKRTAEARGLEEFI